MSEEIASVVIARFEHAGLIVGREMRGLLMSVERDDRRVWYDVGDTRRVLGDESDPDNELFYDVVELLEGREARERVEHRIKFNHEYDNKLLS